MLYGTKMRYSESAQKTQYIHMIFIDFHQVSFFSKDLPVVPLRAESKNVFQRNSVFNVPSLL